MKRLIKITSLIAFLSLAVSHHSFSFNSPESRMGVSTPTKGGNLSSLYQNITNPGSIRNILTNVKTADFIKTLQQSGFQNLGRSKDGLIQFFQRGNVQYNIRNFSKSGFPTAEFLKNGRRILKLRLGK